jgi:hypothetical protein
LFRGYCERRGLKHPEIDRFVDHLWKFIELQPGTDAFKHWIENEPPLTFAGLGERYPEGFADVLRRCGVQEAEFRRVLSCTTEILYHSMYGAADEAASRQFLLQLARTAERLGVVWPDMSCFTGSRWSDFHGWGRPPSAEELIDWRRGSRV